jgi:diguanylate cyclase (GGDEF)-like protein
MPNLYGLRESAIHRQHWLTKKITERQTLNGDLPYSEKVVSDSKMKTELHRLTCLDNLTQIANRRRFQAYLEQNWQQMAQKQASLSIILGDFDLFKLYNASYSHQAGDQCLQQVAQAIDRVFDRPVDLVPRYGGEEFIVILPQTNAEEAVQVAENIRGTVAALKIPLTKSDSSQYLTLSLGVATLVPTDESSCSMLMKAAEQALTQAKKQGRDRVIFHEIEQGQTQVTDEKISASLPTPQYTSVPVSNQHNGAATQTELLKSYIAYYLSRGKSPISPVNGPLPFKKSVYQYWGYHPDFQEFWKQLLSRRDFRELYIEGDVYCFGQFLDGRCTVSECARCNLPIPIPEGHAYDVPNCTLCEQPGFSQPSSDEQKSPNVEEKLGITRVLAIGIPPADAENLEEWFSRNGFQVIFVSHREDISPQSFPFKLDLVLIYESISAAEGKAWAQALARYPQFQAVPIVALSAEAGGGLPWSQRTLGLKDYVLSPYGGDRLAEHLRRLFKSQLRNDTAKLYWFPC